MVKTNKHQCNLMEIIGINLKQKNEIGIVW